MSNTEAWQVGFYIENGTPGTIGYIPPHINQIKEAATKLGWTLLEEIDPINAPELWLADVTPSVVAAIDEDGNYTETIELADGTKVTVEIETY